MRPYTGRRPATMSAAPCLVLAGSRPIRSGIAAYTAELARLAPHYAIDLFVDDPVVDSRRRLAGPTRTGGRRAPPRPAAPTRLTASTARSVRRRCTTSSRHGLAPYDLVVYQLGNARCHDYMWPYLVRYPGLVVLHDAALHHARARALLARGRHG